MGFYSKRQKQLALHVDTADLQKAYTQSERNLDLCARRGSQKELKQAMKIHGDFEYALLYQQSPEYQKIMQKKGKYKLNPNPSEWF